MSLFNKGGIDLNEDTASLFSTGQRVSFSIDGDSGFDQIAFTPEAVNDYSQTSRSQFQQQANPAMTSFHSNAQTTNSVSPVESLANYSSPSMLSSIDKKDHNLSEERREFHPRPISPVYSISSNVSSPKIPALELEVASIEPFIQPSRFRSDSVSTGRLSISQRVTKDLASLHDVEESIKDGYDDTTRRLPPTLSRHSTSTMQMLASFRKELSKGALYDSFPLPSPQRNATPEPTMSYSQPRISNAKLQLLKDISLEIANVVERGTLKGMTESDCVSLQTKIQLQLKCIETLVEPKPGFPSPASPNRI